MCANYFGLGKKENHLHEKISLEDQKKKKKKRSVDMSALTRPGIFQHCSLLDCRLAEWMRHSNAPPQSQTSARHNAPPVS